jgi:hypothetical protein
MHLLQLVAGKGAATLVEYEALVWLIAAGIQIVGQILGVEYAMGCGLPSADTVFEAFALAICRM